MVSPTVLLERRTPSSSSTSPSSTHSKDCNGKDKGKQECQKPASENGLEIGLGVGIPVAVILLVLSYFMYRSYRKDRKEQLEHDPDFDENGDATALPDFPAFTKEDPFARHSSNPFAQNGGYPMMLPNRLGDLRSMLTREDGHDSFVDGFVLPYHHQTGSKALLDEYAKQIMDNNLGRAGPVSGANSTRQSPQKSSLHHRAGWTSSEPFAEKYHEPPRFDVLYENELAPHDTDLEPEVSVPTFNVDSPFEDHHKLDTLQDTSMGLGEKELKGADNANDVERRDVQSEGNVSKRDEVLAHGEGVSQLPEDTASALTTDDHTDLPHETHKPHTYSALLQSSPAHEYPPQQLPSPEDMSFPQSAKELYNADLVISKHEDATKPAVPQVVEPSTEHGDGDLGLTTDQRNTPRSPRLSAFNMLKNVSDDEDDNMTPDQEEQLARIKSVYKVYFDRTNSVKSTKSSHDDHTFQPDHLQPLPVLDVDRLRINNELSGDTRYDKRKTTTSSIYEADDRGVLYPHQQFNAPPPNHFHDKYYAPPTQFHNEYQVPPQNYNEPMAQQEDEPVAELPPLKLLPPASDIRNSTIETFTDYQPRNKIVSPPLRTGNFDESYLQYGSSQTSFLPTEQGVPPMLRPSDAVAKPSPSQLARTSVVMLNPVTEITTLRKFKPAGSLPRVSPTTYYQGGDELANSNDDLIPGNRKSAVRRMMNTNF